MKTSYIISLKKYISRLTLAVAMLGISSCNDDSIFLDVDYTVAGMDMIVTIPIELPKMDVQTRADIEEINLNRVESLWVATFSTSGVMTTNGWKELLPNTNDTEMQQQITLDTKSGPSYIVAVANVDNKGVTKTNLTERPLRELLNEVKSFDDFLNIAVISPSTQTIVNAPDIPFPMVGAYTNIPVGDPHTPQRPLDSWQTENFNSYTIPYTSEGSFLMQGGAIHLRRLVSQVKFNLIPGETTITTPTGSQNVKMKITPHHYKIVNVPKYSWLYERKGVSENGISNFGSNFGDVCIDDNKDAYYASTDEYTSNNMPETVAGSGTYTFNFWQGENKHTGISKEYSDREKQSLEPMQGVDFGQHIQEYTNTGVFTSLTGGTWSSNNMATYVIISCTIDYENKININGQGEIVGDNPEFSNVRRTGNATFIIHLGYINGDATDFNCYRNTKYTYNITINGVNDIRVEAYHGSETPGVEGMVADVIEDFKELDSHYNVYNIYLSEEDLIPWNSSTGSGFGFIMTTYDNLSASGQEKNYTEENFINNTFDGLSADEKKYVDWIELRPTTGEEILAVYKPRTGNYSDGKTFNLVDAAKGISDAQKSTSGWYTLFVKEYTYEAEDSNESIYVNGKPIWHSYVFAPPRRFYIRTTKAVSSDGQSLYARSKYAGLQHSIMSYYDQNSIPTSTEEDKTNGSAIGIECINESFGLNLRRSFTDATDSNNGRYNCWLFTRYIYNRDWFLSGNNVKSSWDYFLDLISPQKVKSVNNNGASYAGGTMTLPMIHRYRPSYSGSKDDPQPNSSDANDYIEAISACLNRNRDNNGDGEINGNEMRWYIPAMGKYLRILIGQDALAPYQIVNYASMPNRPVALNNNWGEYLFFGSEGKVLWAMEGFSTSDYNSYGSAHPWQVRCIRNLGTNLNTFTNTEEEVVDPTIPAYKFFPSDEGNYAKGGRVEFTYYQETTMRTNPYSGNGTGFGKMPVHTIAEEYNSLYRYGFEIHDSSTESDGQKKFDGEMSAQGKNSDRWQHMTNYINNSPVGHLNPCTELGERWRLPNVKELAIMKNLGIIKDETFLSCSMGVITDYTGYKLSKPSDYDDEIHYFMCSIPSGIITQGWKDIYKIRCVRDHIP